MSKIKVEIENKVSDSIKEDLKSFRQKMKAQVFQALTTLEAAILQNIRKNAGLNVMTGKLFNSIGKSKKVTMGADNIVTGEIGPKGVPYAAIHEFGGTVVPKKAQALIIPMPDNTRPDGLPKITAAEVMKSGRGFIRNGIMFERKLGDGKGQNGNQATPMFALKKQVVIPARPYLAPAISQTQEQILKNFGVFLAASFTNKKDE